MVKRASIISAFSSLLMSVRRVISRISSWSSCRDILVIHLFFSFVEFFAGANFGGRGEFFS